MPVTYRILSDMPSFAGTEWPGFAAIGFTTFLAAYLGVAALRHWAHNGRAVDIPNARSSHTQPTPRGGGLLIVIVTLLGLTIYGLSKSRSLDWGFGAYMAGAIIIAAIGWLDDLQSVPFWLRIIVQSLAAIMIIIFIGYLNDITFPVAGSITLGWRGIPLTFVLIVGLINAYNFMDGIDGLAGIQAVLGGLAWLVVGLTLTATPTAVLGILIAASALGFLLHNWSPARIFMGDVGSTFLGFTFAVLIILNGNEDALLAAVGLLFLWPFIFDTSFTLIRRLKRRENIFEAHRTHLYQRLVITGYSHSFVSLLYAGLALVGILLGIAWYMGLPRSDILITITIPLLALGLYSFVILAERGIMGVEPE